MITETYAPPPVFFMTGKVACTRLKLPPTSVAITEAHSAGSNWLMNCICKPGPAAYTTEWTRPKRSCARVAIAATAWLSHKSSWTISASRPNSRTPLTTLCASSSLER
ncbi:hypothetical protein D3C80_1802270 [compost metagenome]